MISVLICTYNRGALINGTLESLIVYQSVKADEIIVVNGGGVNDCEEILNIWKANCTYLIEIKTNNINLANSRNIGLNNCKGDLILMTDDDARVFPDWIAKMKEAHNLYPDVGVIGGHIVDASGHSFLSQMADKITFPFYQEITEVNSVPGVNCSYKKEVVSNIGSQDVDLFRGEDVDYNWRAKKAGWKVLYIPDIKVYHAHRPTWSGLFNQHHMYGRAYYRVRKKWPQMYCIYPRDLLTPKSWAKGIYYLIIPWIFAFKKVKKLKPFYKYVAGYFIIVVLSYYTMYGTYLQWYNDRKLK